MERILKRLRPPAWPDQFPRINTFLADSGAPLFKAHCSTCHLTPDQQAEGEPTERMKPFKETAEGDLTDIWMACNAYIRLTDSGLMAGARLDFFDFTPATDDDVIPQTAPNAMLLDAAVKRVLISQKAELIGAGLRNVFGIEKWKVEVPVVVADRKALKQRCLSDTSPLPAYKARPLDGIWATAPFLHNGSVPTLYHLLLPAKDWPKRFWVGSHEYDPDRIGYAPDPSDDSSTGFEFRTEDDSGNAIPGIANHGHEYGVGNLTEEERLALLEYMKTL